MAKQSKKSTWKRVTKKDSLKMKCGGSVHSSVRKGAKK